MAQASASAGFWLDGERQKDFTSRFWRALAISVVVHLGVLALIAWVRLPKHGERPLASIEISLAAAPAQPEKAEPLEKAAPPPPAPAPPVKMAPAPAPPKPVNAPAKDVMKDVVLPPNAPAFGDFSPTEKPKKTQFKLPDVPLVSDTKEPLARAPESKPRPSLT